MLDLQPLPSVPSESLQGVIQKLEPVSAATRYVAAKDGIYAPLPETIPPPLRDVLAERGISRLYIHQAEALREVEAGRNVVIVTPTASGKTLCYNLPVLNPLLQDPGARALYLFPTKALAEDQLHEFNAIVEQMGSEIRAFTYDGDTPQDARKAIRQRANMVLTNPDMLHTGILPHHTKWAQALRKPALHRHRRAALLPRRLRQPPGQRAAPAAAHLRILRFEAAVHLLLGHHRQSARTGRSAHRTQPSSWWSATARRAARSTFIFYNPPVVNRQLGIRRSYINETRRIALEFIERRLADAGLRQQPAGHRSPGDLSEGRLRQRPPARRDRVRGYRGGYLPRERREIEQRLRDGEHARRGGHQCARTGHRHRLARCGGDGRISGDHRLHLAARGPRRTPADALRRRCWWPPARRSINTSSSIPIISSAARRSTPTSIPTTWKSCWAT